MQEGPLIRLILTVAHTTSYNHAARSAFIAFIAFMGAMMTGAEAGGARGRGRNEKWLQKSTGKLQGFKDSGTGRYADHR